jgi:hypothetical protein
MDWMDDGMTVTLRILMEASFDGAPVASKSFLFPPHPVPFSIINTTNNCQNSSKSQHVLRPLLVGCELGCG